MPLTEMPATRREPPRQMQGFVHRQLKIGAGDTAQIVKLVRAGFPYKRLATFQKATKLPWADVSRFVAIPTRTLTRRQSEGKLQPDESDRVWRAVTIFDKAVELFEGDDAAARKWLQSPQPALGGETPLDFASTEVGAREVEHLIGRLEHGVFT
jgi:putative toxin-antitoxin system antitoxin component (TIGR02293 family)